jgi:hypothetical protein
LYAPLGPLSPIGSLLLVKFIEVATAEPKFEDPPATRNGNIYYPQHSTKMILYIHLRKKKKNYFYLHPISEIEK